MKKKSDLLNTILKLRTKSYTEIPEDLLTNIILIEQNCLDNRTEAHKRIQIAISEYLQNKEAKC